VLEQLGEYAGIAGAIGVGEGRTMLIRLLDMTVRDVLRGREGLTIIEDDIKANFKRNEFSGVKQ